MIRRGIHQPDCDAILLPTLDHPLHTWRPAAMVLRPLIHIANERGDLGEPRTDCRPPLGKAVYETVTGHCGGHAIHAQFIQGRQEEVHGGHGRPGRKIVIGCLNRHPALPAPGAGANFDDGFGIQREPQDVVRRISGMRPGRHLRRWHRLPGFFLWRTLGDLLRRVTKGVELGRQRLHRGERVRRGALLGDELAADFRGTQTGREPGRATLRVRLTLAIDAGFDIGSQGRQVSCHRLTTTRCEGIQTRETTFHLMRALTDSHSAPAEFSFRAPLPAWPQFCDRPCHKEPAGAPGEGSRCFHEQDLEGIGELHMGTSSPGLSGVYQVIGDNLILEIPLMEWHLRSGGRGVMVYGQVEKRAVCIYGN